MDEELRIVSMTSKNSSKVMFSLHFTVLMFMMV